MNTKAMTAALALGLAILGGHGASGAEIRVLSIPLKGPLDQIAPRFERAMGHNLAIKYAPSDPLRKQIEAGEPFDVVMVFPNIIEDLIREGKVVSGTRSDIARAGLGLAVKKGAAKPDIRTVEGFKRALLAANSIAYAAQGPSGIYLIGLLDRLGIAREVKPKLKPMGAGSLVVGPVANGEAEVGIVSIPFILADPGAEFAGPLPRELQDYVHYSSGIGAAARDAALAGAFVAFFRQAESIATLQTNGLEGAEAR
jgi:molybdate transport system substrate-binding protein